MSVRHKALRDAQSAGEGTDTGNFDATIDSKKEAKKWAKKADAKQKADAFSIAKTEFKNAKQSLMMERIVLGNSEGLKI